MKFRKKPVVIEAFCFLPDSDGNFVRPSWLTGHEAFYTPLWEWCLHIKTLEGVMDVRPGDWIIKGVKDEIYSCKPDIFEMTYEKCEDEICSR